MDEGRVVRIFRNGGNQAVRIPREFEFSVKEATMIRDGECLVIRPRPAHGFFATLARLSPLAEEFPDVDEDLVPLKSIDL